MEQKLVKVPFEVEMAKKITNKEIDGKIVTADGRAARIADFNLKEEGYPLLIIAEDSDGGELYYSCALDGKVEHQNDSLSDLMLEIPEYLTFKDGDVISYESGTLILKKIDGKDRVEYYANLYGIYNAFDSACLMKNLVNHLRISTEEEKRKLIVSMKESKEPKAKEYLKRFFGVEVKSECEFKPFDKVLVRNKDTERWMARFFNSIIGTEEFRYGTTSGGFFKQCIPYEGNEKLHNTTDNWEG